MPYQMVHFVYLAKVDGTVELGQVGQLAGLLLKSRPPGEEGNQQSMSTSHCHTSV